MKPAVPEPAVPQIGDQLGLDELDPDRLRRRPGKKWARTRNGELAAWVADMDFPPPPPVRAALTARLATGDLGYPAWEDGQPLAVPFTQRMRERYGWEPDPGRVRTFTDIIQGVQVMLHLATESGDGVLLHTPTYPPFLETLERMDRRLLSLPLGRQGESWVFDTHRLADQARDARALILVNPHNPTGRVLTRTELEQVAQVALANDLLVLSDEVHADLTFGSRQHVPFASLSPEVASRTVTLYSATKAFNLAGIRCAVGHVGDRALLERLDAHPPHLFGLASVFGVEATLAAWRDGDGWLDALRRQLERNRELVTETVADRLSDVDHAPPEGTYLAWLDCRRLELGEDSAAWFHRHAGVLLNPGPDFGPGGEGHVRLNFATSEGVLREVLDRMVAAVSDARTQPAR